MQRTDEQISQNAFRANFIFNHLPGYMEIYDNYKNAREEEKPKVLEKLAQRKEMILKIHNQMEKNYFQNKAFMKEIMDSYDLNVRFHDDFLIFEVDCGLREFKLLFENNIDFDFPAFINSNISTDYEYFLEDETYSLLTTFAELCSQVESSEKETLNKSCQNEKELILTCFEKHRGICIGETHQHRSPKQFLIENMAYLKAQGVTTLYMEHLFYERHQQLLDEYMQSPADAPMPKILELHLEELYYRTWACHGHPDFKGFKKVVEAAKKNGIRVIAIDSDASYQWSEEDVGKRIKTMNMCAYTQFNQHDDGEKYVFFNGNMHAVRYHDSPGISQLLGCTSVFIRDTNDKHPLQSITENDILFTDEINLSFDYIYYRNPEPAPESILSLTESEEKFLNENNLSAPPDHLSLFGNSTSSSNSVVNAPKLAGP